MRLLVRRREPNKNKNRGPGNPDTAVNRIFRWFKPSHIADVTQAQVIQGPGIAGQSRLLQ